MKIILVSPEEHKLLVDIQKNHPRLTFQNEGYQYIKMSTLPVEDLDAHKQVTNILSKSIAGFAKFNNFKLSKNGEACIRFQYDYDHGSNERSFIGVGYMLIDELLNGFK